MESFCLVAPRASNSALPKQNTFPKKTQFSHLTTNIRDRFFFLAVTTHRQLVTKSQRFNLPTTCQSSPPVQPLSTPPVQAPIICPDGTVATYSCFGSSLSQLHSVFLNSPRVVIFTHKLLLHDLKNLASSPLPRDQVKA